MCTALHSFIFRKIRRQIAGCVSSGTTVFIIIIFFLVKWFNG